MNFVTTLRTTDLEFIVASVRKRLSPFDTVYASLLEYNPRGEYIKVGTPTRIIVYTTATFIDYDIESDRYVVTNGVINYANIVGVVKEVIPTPLRDDLESHLKYTAYNTVEEWVYATCKHFGTRAKRRTAWLCKYYGRRKPAPRYKTDVVFLYTFEIENVKLKHDPYVADLLKYHGIDPKKVMLLK